MARREITDELVDELRQFLREHYGLTNAQIVELGRRMVASFEGTKSDSADS